MGKQKKLGLGDSLHSNIRKSRKTPSGRHTTAEPSKDWAVLGLNSLTQDSNLDDFLRTADLAGTDFTAERLNVKVVTPTWTEAIPDQEELEERRKALIEFSCNIKIPRRPPWTKEMTREELDRNEKDHFLIWRKNLANVQENQHIILTPFEKNLEVWRQLWRVVERSDVIMQIVDARNPLLFRTEDLEKYVKDVDPNKDNKLLVNKADFLQDFQREAWTHYFREQGISAIFYSAVDCLDTIQAEQGTEKRSPEEKESSEEEGRALDDDERKMLGKFNKFSALVMEDSDSEEAAASSILEEIIPQVVDEGPVEEVLEEEVIFEAPHTIEEESTPSPLQPEETKDEMSRIKEKLSSGGILSNSELLSYLHSLKGDKEHYTVGLVGYPNVGKSSTVNTLLQEKRVQTSTTPGKTKHFQTFKLGDIMLCDCPGLVFPNTATSRSEMVCNGVLPIDHLRDHVGPISSVISKVPRLVLESLYGIAIPKPDPLEGDRLPYPFEVLREYGLMRGFMTTRGTPDESRSARKILKDYVTGRLLYCAPPPTWDENKAFNPISDLVVARGIACSARAKKTTVTIRREAVERGFFQQKDAKILLKGRGSHTMVGAASGEGNVVGGMVGNAPATGNILSAHQQPTVNKPWKKHFKAGSKEKVRRKAIDLNY